QKDIRSSSSKARRGRASGGASGARKAASELFTSRGERRPDPGHFDPPRHLAGPNRRCPQGTPGAAADGSVPRLRLRPPRHARPLPRVRRGTGMKSEARSTKTRNKFEYQRRNDESSAAPVAPEPFRHFHFSVSDLVSGFVLRIS